MTNEKMRNDWHACQTRSSNFFPFKFLKCHVQVPLSQMNLVPIEAELDEQRNCKYPGI